MQGPPAPAALGHRPYEEVGEGFGPAARAARQPMVRAMRQSSQPLSMRCFCGCGLGSTCGVAPVVPRSSRERLCFAAAAFLSACAFFFVEPEVADVADALTVANTMDLLQSYQLYDI